MVNWLSNLTLVVVLQYVSYWVTFWTLVNALLPPRETFQDFPGFLRFYNVLLLLVGYWGALNVRSLTVKLYSSVSNPAASQPQAFVKSTTEVIPVDSNVEPSKTVTTTPVKKTEDQ